MLEDLLVLFLDLCLLDDFILLKFWQYCERASERKMSKSIISAYSAVCSAESSETSSWAPRACLVYAAAWLPSKSSSAGAETRVLLTADLPPSSVALAACGHTS